MMFLNQNKGHHFLFIFKAGNINNCTMKYMTENRHYTTPQILQVDIIPANVLCESSFGFTIDEDGFIGGDLDSANNGYGFIDNGSY